MAPHFDQFVKKYKVEKFQCKAKGGVKIQNLRILGDLLGPKFETLRYLKLENMGIPTVEPFHGANLPNLELLDFSLNEISFGNTLRTMHVPKIIKIKLTGNPIGQQQFYNGLRIPVQQESNLRSNLTGFGLQNLAMNRQTYAENKVEKFCYFRCLSKTLLILKVNPQTVKKVQSKTI